MRIAKLGSGRPGRIGETLAATGPGVVAIPYRGTPVIAESDALWIDFDAVVGEFAGSFEAGASADLPLADAVASHEMLERARIWRDALARFVEEERFVLLTWSAPPFVRVHTLQDIVAFGPGDFLPGIEFAQRAPESVRLTAGEPLASFYRSLGRLPASACSVRMLRGEAVLAHSSDATPAAIYAHRGPAHLLATPVDPSELVVPAMRVLGAKLGGTGASEFLPWWASAIELPRERELRNRLGSALQERDALAERIRLLRADARRLRALKAIVAGAPPQSARAAREWLREAGIAIPREFVDESALVCVVPVAGPVLLLFVRDDEPDVAERAARLAARYTHEFEEPCRTLIVVNRADAGDANAAREPRIGHALRAAAGDGRCTLCTGAEFLDMLAAPGRTPEARLATFAMNRPFDRPFA